MEGGRRRLYSSWRRGRVDEVRLMSQPSSIQSSSACAKQWLVSRSCLDCCSGSKLSQTT